MAFHWLESSSLAIIVVPLLMMVGAALCPLAVFVPATMGITALVIGGVMHVVQDFHVLGRALFALACAVRGAFARGGLLPRRSAPLVASAPPSPHHLNCALGGLTEVPLAGKPTKTARLAPLVQAPLLGPPHFLLVPPVPLVL